MVKQNIPLCFSAAMQLKKKVYGNGGAFLCFVGSGGFVFDPVDAGATLQGGLALTFGDD